MEEIETIRSQTVITDKDSINNEKLLPEIGHIYIITSTETNKVYIGQTTRSIKKRTKDHFCSARTLQRYNECTSEFDEIPSSVQIIKKSVLYNAMVKHGINTFTVSLLETVNMADLNDKEVFYVEKYNSIAPNGYNMTTGGNSKYKHTAETISLLSEIRHKNIDNNRHECLKGLPLCTTYGNCPTKGGGYYIVVQKHPLCKYRCFLLKDYNNDLDLTKQAVHTFINEIESTKIKYVTPKLFDLKDYPGLKSTKKGFRIEKVYQGQRFVKSFQSGGETKREENKLLAIKYYDDVITPIIKPIIKSVITAQFNDDDGSGQNNLLKIESIPTRESDHP